MAGIVIYAEGGLKLGLGNIYRMLELAKSIAAVQSDIRIKFATSSEAYVGELIREHDFEVMYQHLDQLPKCIGAEEFEVLVVDKLGVDPSFIEEIRKEHPKGFKTVIFGNLSDANLTADLVVNAIIGTDFNNREYWDKGGTHYLTGPKYLSLRDEFIYRGYHHRSQLKDIMLLFGGTDQANLTCKVLLDLLDRPGNYNFTIVIGKGYIFLEELKKIVQGRTNIKVYQDINYVNKLMLKHDFLITSPGTAMFEGFYLGIPCLALFQNESQKEVFRDFLMTKSYEDIENLDQMLNETYHNIESYYASLDQIEVGKGKKDIVNTIINLI